MLNNLLCGLSGKKFSMIKIKVDFAKRIPDDSVSQCGDFNLMLVF